VTAGGKSRRWRVLSDRLLGSHRRFVLLLLDALFAGTALYFAYLLRFEGRIPADYGAQLVQFLPLLILIRLTACWAFGVHHWSFRLAGLSEGVRLVLAGLAGSAGFVAIPYLLGIIGPPRSVVALEFFLNTSLGALLRFSFRLTQPLVLDRRRLRMHDGLLRTLIVGAGSAGDLLLRDLKRSSSHAYEVVGFVDDNRAKWRAHVGGRPVLGSIEELPEIAGRLRIQQLLFAINDLPAGKVREILARCADLKLKYKSLPVSFAYLRDHVNATMLHDLVPEDLLARDQTAFDPAELRALVEGRSVLVTGAAGSIGSEACRQLAEFGTARIVLVDVDENGMYFLLRELQARHPQLSVRAEIADVRDRNRILRLAREYRPDQVFHAAAHKHVPLMEYAPEEAIKNNVTGCRHAVELAEAAGAAHFVLISTDKAVKPTSVMGATKKVAELIVRERAMRSATAFSVVRFGNVLGSAGSVVPLFKRQIASGGPVTVTHPECRRFLMTIPEAVGLVLLAGLSSYGDLCVLEMGEPIRILDLARLMITMSGLVPEQDVPIVFTGLRPGEKLDEVVMTEEEMLQSRSPRHRIRVVRTPPPNGDLLRLVSELEATALGESRAAMLEALQAIVPDYVPSGLVGTPARLRA
jgi:FlaA1/EpsC-like NDP-sugar epimerase